ncbi:hypothetical protein BN873_990025 [Candidatus Competibacter denitrificans Run_A_D11]|uniref:Uncharacterized protein n=1 Tax=Candidatus Competibacter denitrificans Run_A_D11 TaxID=1400863 RepID=W6MBX1_9GAMM|nr:hypothetical protein BN873_990025 [Candidatus Competibacter denitrificans Run_A_D11]
MQASRRGLLAQNLESTMSVPLKMTVFCSDPLSETPIQGPRTLSD